MSLCIAQASLKLSILLLSSFPNPRIRDPTSGVLARFSQPCFRLEGATRKPLAIVDRKKCHSGGSSSLLLICGSAFSSAIQGWVSVKGPSSYRQASSPRQLQGDPPPTSHISYFIFVIHSFFQEWFIEFTAREQWDG